MILEVNNLRCDVPGRTLFSDLSLTLREGETIAVIGPSGSGKSTLISAILGMVATQSGSVKICGSEISASDPQEAALIRRKRVGVVFQQGELLPDLTAGENVAVSMMMSSPASTAPLMKKAHDLLAGVGVNGQTRARDLSGGERQRTALVRALCGSPSLVIGDEPTGSLDTVTRDAVADLLFSAVTERDSALLVVTHDPTISARADQVINLQDYAPVTAEAGVG